MLRSPTVFEDVVKTICTTNCAWSGTVRMVTALVDNLGVAAPAGQAHLSDSRGDGRGRRATSTATSRAPATAARTSAQLADDVASGALDLEELNDPELPDDEVEARLLALPGVGPYAAAHVMLTSLGRYSRLVLDSWTRPTYAKLAGRKASRQDDRAQVPPLRRLRRPRVLAAPDARLGSRRPL